jgi:hypothetical protein
LRAIETAKDPHVFFNGSELSDFFRAWSAHAEVTARVSRLRDSRRSGARAGFPRSPGPDGHFAGLRRAGSVLRGARLARDRRSAVLRHERHHAKALTVVHGNCSVPCDYSDARSSSSRHGRRDLYSEALAVLDAGEKEPTLPLPTLRYQSAATRAIIFADRGDTVQARRFARLAMEAAAATHSGLSYHGSIGLVENPDPVIHEKVRALASACIRRRLPPN